MFYVHALFEYDKGELIGYFTLKNISHANEYMTSAYISSMQSRIFLHGYIVVHT